MGRGIFVTGTDTGVGKTLVTAGMVRWLRRQGLDTVPVKPVQTGCIRQGSRLSAPDLEFCLSACGLQPDSQEIKLMLPYTYEPACSPHLAGRLAGRYPELPVIKASIDRLLAGHAAVVVEGAGGIMAPLNENAVTLDLIKLLGFPVVLVSRLGLGTINHTLLSVQALRAARLKLAGIVFNHTSPSPDSFIEEDNPETIARFSGAAILGKVRCFPEVRPESQAMWRSFQQDMPGLPALLKELSL